MVRGRVGAAGALAGALVGLLLSVLLTAPAGADHSCPAGAPVSSCRYPADLTLWRVEWIGGGLLVGLIVVTALMIVTGRARFPHRV